MKGVMAIATALAGIQGVVALFILFPSSSEAQTACVNHFSCNPQAFGSLDFVDLKNIVITEDAVIDTQLFTCQWDEPGATAPLPSGVLFDQYFSVESTEASKWTCKLKAPLDGVPDYPDLDSTVKGNTIFSDFSDFATCNFEVTITVSDTNSQIPEFNSVSYTLKIAEDWPVNVAVKTDIKIRDQDKDSPNNVVDVSVDDGCPISPEPSEYTDFGGSFKDVNFVLRTGLDYETTTSFDCTITLKDRGTPILSTTTDLTIAIQDKPDEPPVFGSSFYNAKVTDPEPAEGGSQLDTEPEAIRAEDGDRGQPSAITYAMKDFTESIPGTNYFQIDPKTGVVSHIKVIDNDILAEEQLVFELTATDESMDEGTSILLVSLPPIPTTTPEPTTTTPEPTTTTETSTTVLTETSTESSSSTYESSSSPSETPSTTTSLTTESTTSPSMTYSTTSPVVTESTTTPSMTESTTSPVVTESTTTPSMTESTTSPVVTESTTTPSMTYSTTSPVVTESTTTPSMTYSTTSRVVNESTTTPSMTYSTTSPVVTESTTTPSMTYSTTAPVVTESTTTPSMTNSTTSPVVTESNTTPSMTYSTTSPVVTESTTTPSMTYSTTSPVVTESMTTPSMTYSTTSPVVTESTTTPSMTKSTTSPSMSVSTTSPSMSVSKTSTSVTELSSSSSMKLSTTSSSMTELTTSPSVTESTNFSTSTPGPEPSLEFTKEAYGGSVPERFGGPFLTIDVIVELIDRKDVKFSLVGEDSIHFDISSPSAEITLKGDKDAPSPGEYSFTARATAETPEGTELQTTAQINVIVFTASPTRLLLTESLHRPILEENKEKENLFSITLEDTAATIKSYCIVNMNPPNYQEYFELVQGDTWDLLKTGNGINYEDTQEVSFILQVFDEEVEPSACQNKTTAQSLLRNEALVIISIQNLNDEAPVFKVPASESETIFYPKDVALQKVVGPIITLKADDADLKNGDLEESISYSITTESTGFSIEKDTGAIYVNSEFSCEGDGCQINVEASDGIKSAKESTITVKSLDMDSIFTFTLNDIEVSLVDKELGKLSGEIGLQISKVYVNPEIQVSTVVQESFPVHSSRRSFVRYQSSKASPSAEEHWRIEVNVYAMDGDSLISLADFNKKLTDSGRTEAVPFADEEIFNPPATEGSATGLIAAVCVLAILLAVVLVAGGFLMLRRHRSKKKTTPKNISTVGGAYPNRRVSDDEDETKESEDSDKTEDVERISLSLYPSALAVNTDSSAVGENKQESKVGLRRTDPGSPEYYGSSSREPPPSYSKDDSSANKPQAGSGSKAAAGPSLYPSLSSDTTVEPRPATTYLTKNPKKAPPPLNAAPTKSILRGKGGSDAKQDVPLYSNLLQQKDTSKPSVPDIDYKEDDDDDEWAASSFGGLKGSPTLKKKSVTEGEDKKHLEPEEDDYDDNHSGKVSFAREVREIDNPDEKKSNLKKDNTNSDREDEEVKEEEEEKSVAFKVLVDMKVVETENPGPAQKEAAVQAAKEDALEILEANRKKLAASSAEEDDEDEDEEDMLSSL